MKHVAEQFEFTFMDKIHLIDCAEYHEDPYVCDSGGEPKGQCAICGAKWFEHVITALPLEEIESALKIQSERGIIPLTGKVQSAILKP